MKRPAFQFYPADWRKDVELRSCSIAARGLWIDLLCIAHECDPYGHLVVNGKPMSIAQIAGQIGLTAAQCKALLQELIDNGVARVRADGAIYSKRMVDDEAAREVRAQAGREHGAKGAEFGKLGAEFGKLGGRPRKAGSATGDNGGENPGSEPGMKPPLNPLPSSSSSASALVSEEADASSSSPEATKPASKTPTIPCPYQAIVDRFHEALPMLPKVRLMPDKRQKAMRKVWGWVLSSSKTDGARRATNADEALQWFADYFARAAANDWLTGKTPRSAEHSGWQCDIDFLLTDKGMKAVIEKTEAAA